MTDFKNRDLSTQIKCKMVDSTKAPPVKAILLSASSSSGKTNLVKTLCDSKAINSNAFDSKVFDSTASDAVLIVEMDRLRYWKSAELNRQLFVAWCKFDAWRQTAENSTLLDELTQNIQSSEPTVQLIKLRFVDLMVRPSQFISVLPQIMRYKTQHIRFIAILEEYFQQRVIHAVLMPSLPRYFLNLYYRKKLFSYEYLRAGLAERSRLKAMVDRFDIIIKMPLWGIREDYIVNTFQDNL